MNKALTDGIVLMPPPFEGGLDVWSCEDGAPGRSTYDGLDGARIATDDIFGTCLEFRMSAARQKLRFTGETPILPGCYLKVRARVRLISTHGICVQAAAWAGGPRGEHVGGLAETGPAVTCAAQGEIVETSAIIGTGLRAGVDMAWGTRAIFAHVGLDLKGVEGSVVRVENLVVEDVTASFLRPMMDWVDVCDFGAVGDGVADDHGAFVAADRAARGRGILVPEGSYRLSRDLTVQNAIRFVGRIVMGDDHVLVLCRNLDFRTYADAFGDDAVALRHAFQAHCRSDVKTALDMGGCRVDLTEPLVLTAPESSASGRAARILRNGRLRCLNSPGWATVSFEREATCDPEQPACLTMIETVADIPMGSHVSGEGVGREVYVVAVDRARGCLTLSTPLRAARERGKYTFTRYAYALDLSQLSQRMALDLEEMQIECAGEASGVLLGPDIPAVRISACTIHAPRDRGISAPGAGRDGMAVDRCSFTSAENDKHAAARKSIALGADVNGAEIRNTEFSHFGTAIVLHGRGHRIIGNRIFQGDTVAKGPRLAGLVLTRPDVSTVISGNVISDAFIEWTDENVPDPERAAHPFFGGLTVSANVFDCEDAAPSFSWLVIKPSGPDRFLDGLSVIGNTFEARTGAVMRAEKVDIASADLEHRLARNVTFSGNSFANVKQWTVNPVTLEFSQSTPSANWRLELPGNLPFGGCAREVASVTTEGPILNAVTIPVFAMPHVGTNDGQGCRHLRLTWPEPVTGRVNVTLRADRQI